MNTDQILKNLQNALAYKKSKKLKVFVLNTASDKQFGTELIKILRNNDFLCWNGILPGQNHNTEQEKAIYGADIVIALISKSSTVTESRYSALLKVAQDAQNELPRGVIKFVPILIDGYDLPYEFKQYRALDISQENAAEIIAAAFKKRAETKLIKEKRGEVSWS